MYWLVLLDDYSAGFGLMVVVITTCLVVTRVYGKRVCPMGTWGRVGMTKRGGRVTKRYLEGTGWEPAASQCNMRHLFLFLFHWIRFPEISVGLSLVPQTSWVLLPAFPVGRRNASLLLEENALAVLVLGDGSC